MDFSKVLEEWENRGNRDRTAFEKDEAPPAAPTSRAEMERAPVDDEIDLHGLRLDEATATLRHFLRESRQSGYRKVLVIHGKGLHSENQKAVLRDGVHQVLQRDKNVATWGEAGRKEGGRGASWVWLSVRGK